MSASFELKGQRELEAALRAVGEKTRKQAGAALRLEAEFIKTKAQQKTIPKDVGTLVNNVFVQNPVFNGDDISVTIVVGGPSAPYALAIHEHPSAHSPPSWQGKPIEGILSVRGRIPWSLEGRGPKYLERPLNEAIPGMAERIAKAVKL